MPARRVCRRDPLPRRLDEICGRGPQLAWGKESAPSKTHRGFRKGERASEGRGCSERGTLNPDRKANRKGAALFQRLFTHGAGSKSQLKELEVPRNSLKGRIRRPFQQVILSPGPSSRLLHGPPDVCGSL